MKIGIIGAGNIGGNLTRRLTAIGHTVNVANSRGPETLADLAAETEASAVPADEASRDAEIAIVTIPENRVPDLPEGLLDGAAPGAVVIATGNYYPERDGQIEAIEGGQPESRRVEDQLGHPVVKAFNGIRAQHLLDRHQPSGTPGRVALPVAGDDGVAKAKVMALIDDLGFDPIDAGGLDDSWRQQPGTPIYTTDLDARGARESLAAASPDRSEQFRARSA